MSDRPSISANFVRWAFLFFSGNRTELLLSGRCRQMRRYREIRIGTFENTRIGRRWSRALRWPVWILLSDFTRFNYVIAAAVDGEKVPCAFRFRREKAVAFVTPSLFIVRSAHQSLVGNALTRSILLTGARKAIIRALSSQEGWTRSCCIWGFGYGFTIPLSGNSPSARIRTQRSNSYWIWRKRTVAPKHHRIERHRRSMNHSATIVRIGFSATLCGKAHRV